MVKKTDPRIRFWRKVEKRGPRDCWPWTGDKTYHGYGRFYLVTYPVKVARSAHRMAWEYTRGPIPDGLECCHHCDNRPCCNPDHLFIGTHRDNMDDAIKKGRLWAVHGERQGSSKLTDNDVKKIRSTYSNGEISMLKIAKQFQVSEKAIWMILHRNGWKHVP